MALARIMRRREWLSLAVVASAFAACARPLPPPPRPLESTTHAWAVVTPANAEFSIPVSRGYRWRWARSTTADNASEYRWEIGLTSGQDEYHFGFSLFKYPGSKEASGDLAALLKAGQASVWRRTPSGGGSVVEEAKVSVSPADGRVIVRVSDPATLRLLFADRPSKAKVLTRTPETGEVSSEIAISYREASSTVRPPNDALQA